MPTRGVFETVITEALAAEHQTLGDALRAQGGPLTAADAGDRLALLIGRVVRRAIDDLDEDVRAEAGVTLARDLVDVISKAVSEEFAAERPVEPGRVLTELAALRPDGSYGTTRRPHIPLLDTTLLTNAPGEPRVGQQVLTEIDSADRIDVVMAFIRKSGVNPLLEALAKHCASGRSLRVLTTTYTNSTEAAALEALQKIGAQVRVSYDTTTTRLHAKAWLFHRDSGFSTAYVGSSNLTHSAQITGLDWNMRVSGARNPDVLAKIQAVFDSYWAGADFVQYEREQFERFTQQVATSPSLILPPTDLRLELFQERLLEQIALSRSRGQHRNLLVAATGTGKTVMAAIDYARLRDSLPRARLLFVAHREEILERSLATFRHALRDHAFGELWVGGARPKEFDHVFASVQSLAAAPKPIDADHFDVVIIDEFHHAAAPSYQDLVERLKPRELLALTATPERTDGLPLLQWFDGRIAAELRLWDAIDQQRLAPFQYYAVHDGLDLSQLQWRRGRGYDVEDLTRVLTANDVWARLVVAQLAKHVGDTGQMRALGFCVGVAHAKFMARVFNELGIKAVAVDADTPSNERHRALTDLRDRKVNAVFSVDLFNEGVDVPAVDTLLMLRPTDSATLFLQQLGRGLRRHTGKAACTVLDFVGHQHADFRFDLKLRALLGGTRAHLLQHVEEGFPFLPAGCHMQLDRVAQQIVLDSIRNAVPSRWTAKVDELKAGAKGNNAYSLVDYLRDSGIDLDDVYAGDRSWSDLRAAAGLSVAPAGPHEVALRRACGRLLHVDDPVRLEAYARLLSSETEPVVKTLPERERRLLRMLVSQLLTKVAGRNDSLQLGCTILWQHPQVRAELRELTAALSERVTHLTRPLTTHPESPIQVHAQYTRLEILAAFGVGEGAKVAPWQTGVYYAKDAKADLCAFTLDKTSGQFSPTTRYRDYAISPELIHWESQSVVRAASTTGRRYQEHDKNGSHIMLFARERADDRAFTFLGPAHYVSHASEMPMQITWRLEHRLPGDLFAAYAAAVA